jgi:hypothetical protein
MNQAINFVFVDCQPEIENKYNEWYNNVHIPMIMKYDGILRTTRYKLLTGPQGQARYFTVYEFKDQKAMDSFPKSPEYMAVDKELHETWKGPEFNIKLAAQYEVIKTWAK